MFKQCPKCGQKWKTRKEFLDDKNLKLIGYQAYFEELELGLFLFNHTCLTTLGIKAGDFSDLYDGPVFAERLTESDECPGHCMVQENLETCQAKCECAYVREVIQIIKKRK